MKNLLLTDITSVIIILSTTFFFYTDIALAETNSNNSSTNTTNLSFSNRINITNSSWLTPLQTHDKNGNNLTLKYGGSGVPVTGGVYPLGPDFGLKSPLKQYQSNISPKDTQCQVFFKLILKKENNHPACVKPNTAQILIERGWAKQVS